MDPSPAAAAPAAPALQGAAILRWQGWPLVLDRDQAGARSFAPLQCRGFSYAFSASPQFRIPFPRRVNLRFALHLPPTLTYPPAVARALRRDRCRHVVSGGRRCAAFALGAARREADGVTWYVFALQSDLALHGRPALRDHLRGWRKVLMACVLNAACEQGVRDVCLPTAQAVYEMARLSRAYPLTAVPDLWRQIYDRTAREFGMQLAAVESAVNIQSMPHRRASACATFYRLRLSPADPMTDGLAGRPAPEPEFGATQE